MTCNTKRREWSHRLICWAIALLGLLLILAETHGGFLSIPAAGIASAISPLGLPVAQPTLQALPALRPDTATLTFLSLGALAALFHNLVKAPGGA